MRGKNCGNKFNKHNRNSEQKLEMCLFYKTGEQTLKKIDDCQRITILYNMIKILHSFYPAFVNNIMSITIFWNIIATKTCIIHTT